MASSNAPEENIKAMEECLDGLIKQMKSVKLEVEFLEKEENKEKLKDSELAIEAQKRTVESVKRTLEVVRKFVNIDDEETSSVENSVEASKNIGEKSKIGEIAESTEPRPTEANEKVGMIASESDIIIPDTDVPLCESHKALDTDVKVREADRISEAVEKAFNTYAVKPEVLDIKFKRHKHRVETPESKKNEEKDTFKTSDKSVRSEADTDISAACSSAVCGNIELVDSIKENEAENQNVDAESAHANAKFCAEEPDDSTKTNFDTYKDIGMDNPLNAMLFSEQLIEYVLKKLDYHWPSVECARNFPDDSISIRFTNIIGEAVLAVIAANIGTIAECYRKLMGMHVTTVKQYRRECLLTATHYFSKDGYSNDKFFMFAAQLTGLSVFYFADGHTHIAGASAQILSYIVNYYIYQFQFSPIYDWFYLHLTAQNFRRQIKDGVLKFIMPQDSSEFAAYANLSGILK